MKTIVIPTDFSPIAENAMRYGLEMAQAINADILLFHVYTVPVAVGEVPMVMISVDDVERDANAKLRALKTVAERITNGKVIVNIQSKLGNVVDDLEELCLETRPFAVVMGSKGMSGLERAIFGSTTLIAIKHLTTPVIAVPPDKVFTGMTRIGLACDFKNVQETMPAATIKDMVKQFNAELHVLNVDSKQDHDDKDKIAEKSMLHTLLDDVQPNYHYIENDDIETGINEFARANNLDLIISIPKKHTWLSSLFSKGSTKQLVFQSDVPVMCVHED